MTAPLYWRRFNDLERYSVDYVIRSISDTQFPLPIILHVNYCGDKMKCFRDRSLWLHRLSSQQWSSSTTSSTSSFLTMSSPRRIHMCLKYHPRQTIYSAFNWTQHLLIAVGEFRAALSSLSPGRLYKFPSSPSVFLFGNSTLHSFHNLRTFLHLKYSFKEVAVLSNPYFLMVPLGSTIKLDEQSNRIVYIWSDECSHVVTFQPCDSCLWHQIHACKKGNETLTTVNLFLNVCSKARTQKRQNTNTHCTIISALV